MYENDMSNPYNWTGIVEDRDDPLLTNRLRIRIFGFHNTSKVILPTSSLPWAMVGLPVNSPRTTSGPKVGDWVIGFFLDGEAGQFPVVTHVLPGINTTVVQQPIGSPYMPVGETFDRKGQPSTPPLGRGVVAYTAIDKSNRRLEHVCDISVQVDQAVGAIKLWFNEIGKELRATWNIVIETLGLGDPSGEFNKIASLIREGVRIIKEVNRVLKDIQLAINYALTLARKVRNMIDYILNLPAKFAQLFAQCLKKLYQTLSSGIRNLFPDFGDNSVLSDLADVANAVQEGVQVLSETAKTATSIASTPAKFSAILLTPTTKTEATTAAADLTSLLADPTNGIASLTKTSDQLSSSTSSSSKTLVSNLIPKVSPLAAVTSP